MLFFGGTTILSRIPPGAMTAVQGGGFDSVSLCVCTKYGGGGGVCVVEVGVGGPVLTGSFINRGGGVCAREVDVAGRAMAGFVVPSAASAMA